MSQSEPSGAVEQQLEILERIEQSRRFKCTPIMTGGGLMKASLIWLILGAVAALIYWAANAEIDSVVRGIGQVIPDSSTQIIQSLEGGIIAELPVSEGQRVRAGQVLVRIQDKQFSAQFKENLSTRDVLKARVARLLAEGTGESTLTFPKDLIESRPDLVAKEQQLFETRIKNHSAQVNEIQSQLEAEKRKHEAVKPGIASGAVSLTERIDIESRIKEMSNRIEVLVTGYRREALELYDQEAARLAALEESLPANLDRLERAVIRSPIDGIVNAIFIKTQGRVVRSGDPIMEIVPENESLLIEAKLRPADIAFLHPGGKAIVRFTAFDFATYGGLEGTVETIGADTVSGPEGEEFYPIKVRTTSDSLGLDKTTGQDLKLVPGMVAEVDIVTGKRTVMDYLLKPIHRAQQRALREK